MPGLKDLPWNVGSKRLNTLRKRVAGGGRLAGTTDWVETKEDIRVHKQRTDLL